MCDVEKRIAFCSDVPDAAVLVYKTLDSTNSEARRLAERGYTSPTLIIAREQSAGRGRMGRSFYSPKDSGLYMTALFEASESPSDTVQLTTSAAAVTAMAIEELLQIRVDIKWVNDLYLGGKKICGILCESFEALGRRFAVVGIGINLSTVDFPSELADIAGSLGVDRDIRYDLAAKIFSLLWRSYHTADKGDIIAYYKERSIVIGKRIFFVEDGKKNFAKVLDIDVFGRLLVSLDNGGEKILSSGEITLRLDGGDEK